MLFLFTSFTFSILAWLCSFAVDDTACQNLLGRNCQRLTIDACSSIFFSQGAARYNGFGLLRSQPDDANAFSVDVFEASTCVGLGPFGETFSIPNVAMFSCVPATLPLFGDLFRMKLFRECLVSDTNLDEIECSEIGFRPSIVIEAEAYNSPSTRGIINGLSDYDSRGRSDVSLWSTLGVGDAHKQAAIAVRSYALDTCCLSYPSTLVYSLTAYTGQYSLYIRYLIDLSRFRNLINGSAYVFIPETGLDGHPTLAIALNTSDASKFQWIKAPVVYTAPQSTEKQIVSFSVKAYDPGVVLDRLVFVPEEINVTQAILDGNEGERDRETRDPFRN
jgi:hypothetical protein